MFSSAVYHASLVTQLVKNTPAIHVEPGSIPGSGRPPREWIGYPLQYFAWRIPMDRGALPAIVHGIAKRRS